MRPREREGLPSGDRLKWGRLKSSSLHLQPAFGRLRFLFSASGSSELDRLLQTKTRSVAAGAIMRLAEREGLPSGDRLKWGRLQSNGCPFAPRTPIFVFALLTEQAPQRSKTKMPRQGRGLPFDWRRERDSNPRRLSPQRFSRPPHSTALPSLRAQN
jgi:hypothetical protein